MADGPDGRADLSATAKPGAWRQPVLQALRAGRPAEARQALRAALAAWPGDAEAWLRLARLSAPRARLAYTARAIEAARAAGQTGPGSVAQRAEAELRQVRQLARAPTAGPKGPGSAGRARLARNPSGAASPRLYLAVAGLVAAFLVALAGMLAWPVLASDTDVLPALAEVGGQLALVAASATPTASASPSPRPTATATASPTATPTASPTPSPSPTDPPVAGAAAAPALAGERWIEVDLGDQAVVAYEGSVPVNRFVASTGTWQFPTVVGDFKIYVMYASADMAGPGYYLAAVPYVMYFYQGYGLHGTYWHNNFGTPMSHGCVNLRTDDAAWLFSWASVGTRVSVHE